MINKILCLFLVLFLLAGCMTFQIKELPPDNELVAFKPLKVEMSYDVYNVRLDIERQTTTHTTTTTDAKGNTRTVTETVPVPYHYIGVDLGNGLFLDARLNLAINLVKLFDLERLDYFKVTQTVSGLFGSTTVFEKDGNQVTNKVMTLFGPEVHVTLKDNGAHIQGGFLVSDQDVVIDANQITYDPHTIFGDWSITKIIKTPAGLKIPGFWHDFAIIQNDDGGISLGDNLKIRQEDKKIILDYSGIFGFKKRFTFMRTAKSFYYFDENGYGFMAEVYQDGVVVKYAMQEQVYKIVRSKS